MYIYLSIYLPLSIYLSIYIYLSTYLYGCCEITPSGKGKGPSAAHDDSEVEQRVSVGRYPQSLPPAHHALRVRKRTRERARERQSEREREREADRDRERESARGQDTKTRCSIQCQMLATMRYTMLVTLVDPRGVRCASGAWFLDEGVSFLLHFSRGKS